MNYRREKKTIEKMIGIYCRNLHNSKDICHDCKILLEYALNRIEKCPLIENKPTCVDCKIHCYNKEMKEKIRIVMRYSGPKMIYHHPQLAILHLMRKRSF